MLIWAAPIVLAVALAPSKPPRVLADHRATARTRALFNYLIDQYGAKTLSGQPEPAESDYIRDVTGKAPAIVGSDFMDYSPSRVARNGMPKDGTEEMIRRGRSGQILTMC